LARVVKTNFLAHVYLHNLEPEAQGTEKEGGNMGKRHKSSSLVEIYTKHNRECMNIGSLYILNAEPSIHCRFRGRKTRMITEGSHRSP
jgi:hypothetical protein